MQTRVLYSRVRYSKTCVTELQCVNFHPSFMLEVILGHPVSTVVFQCVHFSPSFMLEVIVGHPVSAVVLQCVHFPLALCSKIL